MTGSGGGSPVLRAHLPDGGELPIVDVTHPAFVVDDRVESLARWRAGIAAPRDRVQSKGRGVQPPGPLMPGLFARIFGTSRGYLDGWATYLLKTGVENLPSSASELERRLLSSPNAMSLRVRLQQLSHLLANALDPDAPFIRIVTIGGGTAIEALNALIILARRIAPRRLPPVEIVVLDVDSEGSVLGEAALRTLTGSGAPLAGARISLRFSLFSWTEPQELSSIVSKWAGEEANTIVSSEGALFEYASDEVVATNLRFWREAGRIPIAGSVIRTDAVGRAMVESSPFMLFSRGIEGIEALAQQAGYRLARSVEGVASDQFLLEPVEWPSAGR